MIRIHTKFKIILLFVLFSNLVFGCKGRIDIFSSSEIELVQLTFSYRDHYQSWSPDGSEIIFAHWSGSREELWIVDVNSRKTRLFSYGSDPAWHPIDEDVIAFQEDGNIFKTKGKLKQQMTYDNYFDNKPAWSPDGSKIAFTREMDKKTIWVMNVDITGLTQLTSGLDTHSHWHSFSYDGSQIVYIESSVPESGINEIWIMNSDGTDKHRLFAPGNSSQKIYRQAWNKNDKILFSRTYTEDINSGAAADLWIINADGSGASAILESPVYSYDGPVWNKLGNRIAINVGSSKKVERTSSKKSEVGDNIYFFPYE